jgi:predicted nucleotidyltransferase
MLSTITNHSLELHEICQRLGVRRLEVFGSASRGDFDRATSDLDFLVEFISDDWHGAADRWFGLIENLEALFGRKVDLVDVTAAKNPYFLELIQQDRVELYAA